MDDIWELAESQYALFARWQAATYGMTWRQLDTRLRRGDIELWSDRVLRLRGAPRSPEQDLMGAVLDAGPGAVVTKRSAAWLWRLPGCKPGPLDVVRGRGFRARDGASSRWPRSVPPDHITVVRGIPVFTMARTVYELAGIDRWRPRLPRMIDTVDGRDPSLLIALHEMFPQVAVRGKPGIGFMRETLAARPPDRIRLTGLERRFEHDLESAGIPIPRRQVNLGGHRWIGRFDYYDDPIKVIYEIDSAAHHRSHLDQLHDRQRDTEALASGFNEVVRIAEEDVWYDPPKVRRIVLATRRKWRSARPA